MIQGRTAPHHRITKITCTNALYCGEKNADYLRAKYLFKPEEEPFLPTDSML